MTITRGPVDLEQPIDVLRRDLDQRRTDLGRVAGHVGRLGLPAGERRVAGDRRDRTAEPASVLGGQVVGEQEASPNVPGVDPVLVGDRPGRTGGPSGTARRGAYDTFSVHDQAKPRSRAGASTRLQQPRLADAGIALDHDRAAAAGPPRPLERCRPIAAELLVSGRPAGPATRHGTGSTGPSRPRRASACSSTAVDWPRRTTAPRGSVASRPRAARTRRVVEQDLAGPGHRLDPRRRRDRLAGQSQVAIRVDGPVGPGHDLAGGDPDPDVEWLAVRPRLLEPGPDRQRGERRSDRVVVMGSRPAEDREHARRR